MSFPRVKKGAARVVRPTHAEHGVRVRVDELQRIRGDAARLAPANADTVSSLFPGAYRALFRGRGLDFEEVRAYQSGDDYRNLDWRVTARTGHLHTKIFHEEREHTLFIIADAGVGMHFGTCNAFKWVVAARMAALFAWIAVDNGDRVGGVLFGEGQPFRLHRPAFGEGGALQLFKLLAEARFAEGQDGSPMGEALGRIQHLARPGSLILILSDFADLNPEINRHISRLARHNDVAAVLIYDPMEEELPPPGLYPVSDGRRMFLLDSGDISMREDFARHFRTHLESVETACRRYGVRFFTMGTHQSLVETLRAELFL